MAHDQFERTLVWRSLHWQARPFYWLLRLNRDYFSADYEFVRGVGELRSRRQFHDEVAAFQYHPDNRRMLRKSLRMRVSGHRLQDIFENEIKRANTATPF